MLPHLPRPCELISIFAGFIKTVFSAGLNTVNIVASAGCMGLSARQLDQQLHGCQSLHEWQCQKLKQLRSDATELGKLSEDLMQSYARTDQLFNTMDTMNGQFETMDANYRQIRNTAVESALMNGQIKIFRNLRNNAFEQAAALNISYQNMTINNIDIKLRNIVAKTQSKNQSDFEKRLAYAGITVDAFSLAWSLWKLSGVELISKIYTWMNLPDEGKLFIIDTSVELDGSGYSYKIGVDKEAGRSFIIEEQRYTNKKTVDEFVRKIIPMDKSGKNKVGWFVMKGLSSRSKHQIVRFLEDNWSNGQRKLELLFAKPELANTMEKNGMLVEVIMDLDTLDDPAEINSLLNQYDEVNKMEIEEGQKLNRMKEIKWARDNDVTEIFESQGRDLSDHWQAKETKVDPKAIRKTANFEKNKNRGTKKKIKMAFKGKDDLVNFLLETKQYDKTLQRSLDLERDEYKQYVNEMEKKYENMRTDPVTKEEMPITKNKKRDFRQKCDEDFRKRPKLPVVGVHQTILKSNLPPDIKTVLTFHAVDHIVAKNVESILTLEKGKLNNFNDAKQLLEYMKREKSLTEFVKLLNDSPDNFENSLKLIDEWKTSKHGSVTKPGELQTKLGVSAFRCMYRNLHSYFRSLAAT